MLKSMLSSCSSLPIDLSDPRYLACRIHVRVIRKQKCQCFSVSSLRSCNGWGMTILQKKKLTNQYQNFIMFSSGKINSNRYVNVVILPLTANRYFYTGVFCAAVHCSPH
jgi:hypothetical protein